MWTDLRLLPGLALVAAVVAAGILLNRAIPQVSTLIFAMGLGVLLAPLAVRPAGCRAGDRVRVASPAARRRRAARPADLAARGLGPRRARRRGRGRRRRRHDARDDRARAPARRRPVARDPDRHRQRDLRRVGDRGDAGRRTADEDRVGYAIGTVTLFGSVAMLTLPYVFVPRSGSPTSSAGCGRAPRSTRSRRSPRPAPRSRPPRSRSPR